MADIFQDDLSSTEDFSEVEDADLFGGSENNTSNLEHSEEDQGDKNSGDSFDEDLSSNPVEQLPRAVSLKKLAESDHIYNRQLASRNILDTLIEVFSNKDELHAVISTISKLANDDESMVRAELVERIPQIASFCREHACDLDVLIRQQLVPMTFKLTEDHQVQVRKVGQSSLLALLERGLVDHSLLVEWICPSIGQQTMVLNATEERRIEVVSLMCRMAPLVGKEITVRCFLEQFRCLCMDTIFSIRKVCALSFGEFCKVVGTESAENDLMPKFLILCNDDVWGVRKSCAEVFLDVSAVVTEKTRREILPSLFINLLCDDSRWVRFSAYQSLGGFISTFADPKRTGLLYNEDGTWTSLEEESFSSISQSHSGENCMEALAAFAEESTNASGEGGFTQDNLEIHCTNYDDSESSDKELLNKFLLNSVNHSGTSLSESVPSNKLDSNLDHRVLSPESILQTSANDSVSSHSERTQVALETSKKLDYLRDDSKFTEFSENKRFRKRSSSESALTVTLKDGQLQLHLANENGFNHFQYWRMPIPEIELDDDDDDMDEQVSDIRGRESGHKEREKYSSFDTSLKIAASKMEGQTLEVADKLKSGDDCNSEISISSSRELTTAQMQIQTAFVNMIAPNSAAEESNNLQEGVKFVHSSFDEAKLTLTQELKQSRSDHSSPDSRMPPMNLFRQHTLSVDSLSSEECRLTAYEQDVVPPELLDKYICMVEPTLSQFIDSEITRYCAYSLPAVTYTLGRQFWPCLRRVCEILACDMQWKVRKTVAASLHELALMLGSEIATRDLLPLFLALLKDLDEVRMGILMNIAQFLKHLRPRERREFLPLIEEFLKMDNERNWRFRHTLAQQMIPTTALYSPTDVREYLVPVAMWLIKDRVSEVRQAAIQLIAVILTRLCQNTEPSYVLWLLTELDAKFRHAQKWIWRQTYALLCEQFALEKSLPREMYIGKVVPNLLSLAWDTVPNVRIAVARCLSQTLVPLDYLPSIRKAHYQLLLQVMYLLQSDVDTDVRYFSIKSLEAFNVPSQMFSPV